jgi:RNA polymerase sigma-70 factor, ECF subfamily
MNKKSLTVRPHQERPFLRATLQLEYSVRCRFVQPFFSASSGTGEGSRKNLEQNPTDGNIHIGTMLIPPRGLAGEALFPRPAVAAIAGGPSEVECQVINLFDRFRSPLLRYALSLGLSVHDAEEVIQEAFLALFSHLQLGKSRRNLRGWIFRVAHNLALKRRVDNKRLRDRLGTDASVIDELLDAAPNPEERMASGQGIGRLQTTFRALPEQDRWCLTLRAEGLRYREIATTLGISLGSVSISLARSLARLRSASQGRTL